MRGLQRAGVGVALGVLVLAGCAGEDDGASADSGQESGQVDESPGSDTATEPGSDTEGFCADLEAAEERFDAALEEPTLDDPQAAAESLAEAVDVMRGVEAPSEIAADWAVMVEFLDTMATATGELDINDPTALAEQVEELGRLLDDESGELEAAGTNIDNFLSEECGISLS